MRTKIAVIDRLQSHVLSLKENDFTKQILIPLFKQLGYERVDFYGGPNEEGKDLICWKRDELGMVDLSVVQVKYYKPTAKAGDNKSFSEVITQLQQASEKRVPFLDGKLYPPSVVYLVTPYSINTRTLETRFEGIVGLRNVRIKIIDGVILAELISKHMPHLLDDLYGIGHVAIESLSNAELRNALNVSTLKDPSSIYNDLDFAIGNITTKILLELQFKPTIKQISLNDTEWMDIKPICEKISETLKVRMIEEDLASIDASYVNQVKKNAETALQIKKINIKIEKQDIDGIIKLIMAGCRNEHEISVVNIYSDIKKANAIKRDKYDDYLKSITASVDKLYDAKSQLSNESLFPVLKEYKRLYSNISKLENKKIQLIKAKKLPSYQVTINGVKLASKLREMQQSLKKAINKLNNEKRTKALMASFVNNCEDILLHANTLLNIPIISEAIGVDKKFQYANVGSLARLEFSVHEVFDSESNTALYGDAGAGKTTTLQIYARKRIDREKNAIVFFISLAKAFNTLDMTAITDIDFTQVLLNSIINHLQKVDVDINETSLKKE